MPFFSDASTKVNTFTNGDQRAQQITKLADGGWVTTWQSSLQDSDLSGASTGVFQQRYNADGTRHGGEIHVNSYTQSSQSDPKITALSNGGWVVAWNSHGQDGSSPSLGVYQQAFGSNGSRIGGETQVNVATDLGQQDPVPVALANGGWVTVWGSQEDDGTAFGTFRIYQRLYSPTGAAISAEIAVGDTVAGQLSTPSTTALNNGGWVVTWSTAGSNTAVYQEVFSKSGSIVHAAEQVNTFEPYSQTDSKIAALNNGGWVVTWTSYVQDGDQSGIYQQAYNAAGAKLGGEIQVNTTTADAQSGSVVVPLKSGGWVVTWQSTKGFDRSLYEQAFDASGHKLGSETQISGPSHPIPQHTIVALTGGGWVVVWNGVDGEDTVNGSPAESGGILMQVFKANGSKDGGPQIVNTVTAGGQALDSSVGRNQDKVIALADGGFVVTWTSTGQDGNGLGVYQRAFHPGTAAPTGITGTLSFTEGKGGTVGTLHAVDADSASGFKWTMVDDAGGRFSINSTSGKVSVANPLLLDYEQAQTHTVKIKVTDAEGNSFSKTLTVKGTDVASEDLTGSSKADKLFGGSKVDHFRGADGNDTLRGGGGKDVLDGGDGFDKADYSDKSKSVEVKLDGAHAVTVKVNGVAEDSIKNIENLAGGSAADKLTGDGNANTFTGAAGADTLDGGKGDDHLAGGDGKDTLIGGSGADTLSGYNVGSTSNDGDRDTFRFVTVSESGTSASSRDVIWGTFTNGTSQGDLIDLKRIDADGDFHDGNGSFKFIGSKSFTSGTFGEVQVKATSHANEYLVSIDTDKDAAPEMSILVHSTHLLLAGDFVL